MDKMRSLVQYRISNSHNDIINVNSHFSLILAAIGAV